MDQTGGNHNAEEPANTGIQDGTKDDGTNNPPRPPDRFFMVFWGFIGITVMVLAGIVRWNFLPPDGRYFWPASAEDYAAWGTWASAFGTIGAVYFAAQSIKTAIDAQKGTERELKADREHDRREREKERDLVREEREALKKETDRIALNEAGRLTFTYGWGPPSDVEYLEVQYRWHQESLERQERWMEALEAEEEADDKALRFVHVVITNESKDLVFEDLSLWLREEDVRVTEVSLSERHLPPTHGSGDQLEGTPPSWTLRSDYDPLYPPQKNQWALGSIAPRQQLMLKFSFATPQSYDEWSPLNLWPDEGRGYSTPRNLVLGYRDQAKRHWIRSTRSPRNAPHRLLEPSLLNV